ncbi:MAG TPA: molecular chaperone DnaJ [Blastocatellia bacterium]|nr:molecular chaperone DnaJ [Blastocatellia bacterium]
MGEKRDYYEILGVGRTCTDGELKSAYRKLAVKYHPDKNPGDQEAEERFKEAAEAYSVLSNAEQRAKYDRFGHAGVGGAAAAGAGFGGFSNFEDILGDLFGFGDLFGSGNRRRNSAQRGSDLRYDIEISLEEAAAGMKTKIRIPRLEQCDECGGKGAAPGTDPTTCPTCEGHGQVRYQQGFFSVSRTCGHCRGTGQVIKKPCKSCKGEGRVQNEKSLELKLPAGIDTGARLRVSGEGEAGTNSGPSGDLYVVVHVREHDVFERQGNNLYCTVPITFTQAALGSEITVPTLDEEETVKVPEGTQTGTVFRVKGKGIVSLNGRGRGDLFVTVTITTPKSLTHEQKRLLQEFASLEKKGEQDKGLFNKVKDIFG